MNEKYLVINAGSSSLKYSLYEMPGEVELINGYVEKIGMKDCFTTIKMNGTKTTHSEYLKNHEEAVKIMMIDLLKNGVIEDIKEIKGIGHRVLHGAEFYTESVVIDDDVLKNIIDLKKLGPLHHPGEIAGILAMQEYIPNAVEVAVFDTAFHQTMPKENYIYPVPYEWYEKYGVRRYGFHGTSHKYITNVMKEKLAKEDINLIICHIGSGASISCIKDGKCFDTSMGLTPLDGLMMGTRCGSIDPSIIEYISKCTSKSISEITDILNQGSGLLGISSKNDFRDTEELMKLGDENATLAFNMLKDSIKKYIGQYYFELNGHIDAIVFTAGIGENGINLRKAIMEDISDAIGDSFNSLANENIARFKQFQSGLITSEDSKVPVYVIPTNEEVMILTDTYKLANEMKKNKMKIKK